MSLFQLDYGGFDPRFVGIILTVENERVWRLLALLDQPDQAERTHVQDLGEPEALEILCAQSVLAHETRHYHDFLISPYSTEVLQQRLTAAINCEQLLGFLLDPPSNCLPVPLTKWARLNTVEREEVRRSWPSHGDGRVWRPVDIPILEATAESLPAGITELPSDTPREGIVTVLMSGILQTLEDIRRTTLIHDSNGKIGSLQPWQIYELSALLVQVQYLWSMYGQAEVEVFLSYLLKMPGPYGDVMRLTWHLWDLEGTFLETRLANAMAFWSMCGSFRDDGLGGSPAARFTVLWRLFREEGIPTWTDDIFTMFDGWSRRTGLAQVKHAIEDGLERYRRFTESITNVVSREARARGVSEFGNALLEVTQGLLRAKEEAVSVVLDSPIRYVHPLEYLNCTDDLDAPFVRVVFEEECRLLVPAEHQPGAIVSFGQEHEDGGVLAKVLLLPPSDGAPKHFSLRSVEMVSSFMQITDMLFSESGRTSFENEITKSLLEEERALVPIEVLA